MEMPMKSIIPNGSSDCVLIEALFAPGCKSRDATVHMIEKTTHKRGVDYDYYEIIVSSISEAQKHKFLGSPTIRVNGYDIEPESIDRTDFAFG
ncbi:MAG: hypothetical protein ACI8PB_001130 [Desulforhopalus sp.]|jgi:hypothetical protein